MSGLTLAADPLIGTTQTERARFVNLLELLQSIAVKAGDLGFKIVQSGTSLEFSIYAPVDRSATVVFSPLTGTLRSFGYLAEAATGNQVVVAGGGEGTARTFVEDGDAASQIAYGRIEWLRDRRDTTDTTELAQTADEELAQRAEKTALSIQPIDTDAQAFGTHYGLGDRVTVVITEDETSTSTTTRRPFVQTTQTIPSSATTTTTTPVVLTTIEGVLREVLISLTADGGEVVTPAVATPGATTGTVSRLFDSQRRLERRLSLLERR